MALRGLKVIELQGLAPVPFAGLILRDYGARVIKVDRTTKTSGPGVPEISLASGKESLAVNLQSPLGQEIFRQLANKSDILLDPYRPGILEKLGIGPDVLLEKNPRLVIGRLTGFGQTGPYALQAGHDINYVAMSGILSALGRHGQSPTPPLNLLADMAGGSLTCVNGILAAIIQRGRTGLGQVVDCSMTEGIAYLSSFVHRARECGLWDRERGKNLLDSGCPFYDTYETKDGRWLAIGCLEPKFYQQFVSRLGVAVKDLPEQYDEGQWQVLRNVFATTIKQKTREEWEAIYQGTDACVSPVLTLEEWAVDPSTIERQGQLSNGLPAPAPRLSNSKMGDESPAAPKLGQHTRAILSELGYSAQQTELFLAEGVVHAADT